MAVAHTAEPACARTVFRPTARSSVLLPDMFDPVTSTKVPGGPIVRSLVTIVSGGRSGWPSCRAVMQERPLTVSLCSTGKHQSGFACATPASAASDSISPSAPNHASM